MRISAHAENAKNIYMTIKTICLLCMQRANKIIRSRNENLHTRHKVNNSSILFIVESFKHRSSRQDYRDATKNFHIPPYRRPRCSATAYSRYSCYRHHIFHYAESTLDPFIGTMKILGRLSFVFPFPNLSVYSVCERECVRWQNSFMQQLKGYVPGDMWNHYCLMEPGFFNFIFEYELYWIACL